MMKSEPLTLERIEELRSDLEWHESRGRLRGFSHSQLFALLSLARRAIQCGPVVEACIEIAADDGPTGPWAIEQLEKIRELLVTAGLIDRNGARR